MTVSAPQLRMNLFRRAAHADIAHMRFAALLAAVGLYACASSPTPNHPGVIEALIALLLGFAAAPALLQLGIFSAARPLWHVAGATLLVYGLGVGPLAGVIMGNAPGLMIRDIIPFLFLLAPLFFCDLAGRDARAFKFTLAAVAVAGVIFALRALADIGSGFFSILANFSSGELTYFANAPTVLFAALILPGLAGEKLLRGWTLRAVLLFIAALLLALVVIAPVMLTAQRASMGYAALYALILGAAALIAYPRRALLIGVGLVALSVPAWGAGALIFEALAQKSALVGFNARFEELAAVWGEIAANPLSLIFGRGWGASFESPAVAGIRVNYTHSLLSAMLLKTGLAGLALTGLYIAGLARVLWAHLYARPVLVLALAGPVLIDTLLYASYKSLDFGLILLLAAALGMRPGKVA